VRLGSGALLLMVLGIGDGVASPQLEGCNSPATVGLALERLSSSKWSSLSLGRLEAVWGERLPTLELTVSQHGPNGPEERVRIVGHRQRVVRDACQCCEMIEVEGSVSGEEDEVVRLVAVTVTYSHKSLSGVLSAAMLYAAKIGGRGLIVFSDAESRDLAKTKVAEKQVVRPLLGTAPETELVNIRVWQDEKVWTTRVYWMRDRPSN
jgi:hypothetical protein